MQDHLYYHVTGALWQPGMDLLSYEEQEARYGSPPEWIWDGEPFDADVVALFQTLDEARAMREEFRPGCRILAIHVEGDAFHEPLHLVYVAEGYPAVIGRIPAGLIDVFE